MSNNISRLTFSDSFCGAGGSTTGLKLARLDYSNPTQDIEVIWAANHSKLAIDTHSTNHPETDHRLCDLLVEDPAGFPETFGAWLSPDCPGHGDARGRSDDNNYRQRDLWDEWKPDPAAERSRLTMDACIYFASRHKYRVVIIENVPQVLRWRHFEEWRRDMHNLGYKSQIVFWNAQFFHPLNGISSSAPQSRDRVYICFTRIGDPDLDLEFRPWAWCPVCEKYVRAVQSFKPGCKPWARYETQYVYCCPEPDCYEFYDTKKYKTQDPALPGYEELAKVRYKVRRRKTQVKPIYRPAWTAIDFSLPAPLIGERGQGKYKKLKPLKEKTLTRIRVGLEKYGRQPLIIPGDYRHALNHTGYPMTDPLGTLTRWQTTGMAVPPGFVVRFKGPLESSAKMLDEAFPSFTRAGGPGVIEIPGFIVKMRGTGTATSLEEALDTITRGGNHFGVFTQAPFLVQYHDRESAHQAVTEAFSTQTREPRHGLVLPSMPFIIQNHFGRDDTGRPVDREMPAITRGQRQGLVLPPFITSYYSEGGQLSGIDEAIPTIPRVDRHALVQPESILIEECRFRMMIPREIKLGMGFPDEYVILGSNREQVNQAGAAVCPCHAERLGQAVLKTFDSFRGYA